MYEQQDGGGPPGQHGSAGQQDCDGQDSLKAEARAELSGSDIKLGKKEPQIYSLFHKRKNGVSLSLKNFSLLRQMTAPLMNASPPQMSS